MTRQPMPAWMLASPERAPEPAEPETPAPTVTHEPAQVAANIVGSVMAYMESGGQGEALALVHKDAFSEAAAAERYELVAQLSERLGINVGLRLDNALYQWAEGRGHSRVQVDPWMKEALGLDDPEQTQVVEGGAKSEIILGIDDNNLGYVMTEIQFPNTHVDGEGTAIATAPRVIYFSTFENNYS